MNLKLVWKENKKMSDCEYGYIKSKNSYTVVLDGVTKMIEKSHKNFPSLEKELSKPFSEINWEEVKKLVDIKTKVLSYVGRNLKYIDGSFVYKNPETQEEKILSQNYLVNKILEMDRKGEDCTKLLNFLENLVLNPSQSSVDELFLFLEKNKMPLTDDGCFLAYKRVRQDYKDCHSGTFDNRVGKIVQMPREQVNANRYETCSTGLHFCSKDYLGHFYGDNIMVLKINPKDVVSIPNDYNESKGRCCRYEVIAQLENEESKLEKYSEAQNKMASTFSKPDNQSLVYSSIKKALKGLKKEDRKEGMLVYIVNRDGTKQYVFNGGITNKHFVQASKAIENIPTFKSIKIALKEYKDRREGDKIKVQNKLGSAVYQFIGGTTNKHLSKVL